MGRYDDLKRQQGPFKSLFNEVGSAERQSRAHTSTPPLTTPSFKPATSPGMESKEYEKKTSQDPMEEDRQTGSIPWSIYATYLSAIGNPIWSLLFGSMLILTQVATVGNNLLLGFWSADSWSLTQGEYMAVYAGLSVEIGLFTVNRTFFPNSKTLLTTKSVCCILCYVPGWSWVFLRSLCKSMGTRHEGANEMARSDSRGFSSKGQFSH